MRQQSNGIGVFVQLAPGVRIRASSRGLRTSIGPRAARLSIGGGRAGISTGVGPFSLYSSLGSGRRARRSSGPAKVSIAARQRQLAQAAKVAEAQQLITAFQAILAIHRDAPDPVEPPVAPLPRPANESEIRRRHIKAAIVGISIFNRAERARAKSTAEAAALAEIAAENARAQHERQRIQDELDQRWRSLCANDPDVLLPTLAEAFEDNEAPAAPVGVEADEVAIVVLVPGLDVVPERMPQTTAAGNLSIPKLSKGKRSGFYRLVVCGHLLATCREAFAVAPGILSVRAAVIRVSERDAYGRCRPECLLAGRFVRRAFDGVQWATTDASRIVADTSTDLLVRGVGQAKELAPLDLSSQPELVALLAAVDLDDLVHPDARVQEAQSAPPQYSADGQWWWDGSQWLPVPQIAPSAPQPPTEVASQDHPSLPTEGAGREYPSPPS